MSNVTSIVLTFGLSEEVDAEDYFPAIERLNAWMMERHKCAFNRVTDSAGGNKAMQAEVFLCAVNYLDESDFDKALVACKFEEPESVCVLLNREQDGGFSEMHWGSRPPY